MFTGIIEETGKISNITNNSIEIVANTILEETKIGDSIAVNGVCLTVTNILKDRFTADISQETFKITSLKYITNGSCVNLERALPSNGRFGGHIVTGHVDSTGRIYNIKRNGDFYNLEIDLPTESAKYVVRKGSIAIDGISLTIAEINNNIVKIAIIPHTYENTAIKSLKIGDIVNIETDILAKYIEKFLSTSDNRIGINLEFLKENGF